MIRDDNQQERAVFFIDGNNWYHAARKIRINSSTLDYPRFAQKLSLDIRDVHEIRYYVGKVKGNLTLARNQERFLATIKKQGVKVILGRVERKQERHSANQIRKGLENILSSYGDRIKPPAVLSRLTELARRDTYSYTEKRVDVNIAIDMVSMAMKNEFDVAYLVSADGDFVPAVEAVRELGKKVFTATPASGYELKQAANRFILLKPEWFSKDIFLGS